MGLIQSEVKIAQAQSADLNPRAKAKTADWKLAELKSFLLRATEAEIKEVMPGLSSDVIGCVAASIVRERERKQFSSFNSTRNRLLIIMDAH